MHLNHCLQRGFMKLCFNPLVTISSLPLHSFTVVNRMSSSIAQFGPLTTKPCSHLQTQCCYTTIEQDRQRRMYSSAGLVPYVDENIPMPHGFIGARRWGDPSKNPIVVVHGWKDNLASFDRLLPLLLPSLGHKYFFLAIDLPGHGFSSHFSPGMTYQLIDCLLVVERIIRHYKWTLPINFMGHSLGAILGFIYSASNPGKIDKLVTLDALTPIIFPDREILDLVPEAIAESLKFEEKLAKGKPPVYSYEDILHRLMMRNMGGLDEECCKILLSRGICENEPGSGLFHFTHDIRVKYLPMVMLSSKQVKSIAENFQSQLLHIIAKDGVNYELPYVRTNVEEWIRSNPHAESNRVIKFIEVEGYHHVHLVAPERISAEIIKFFVN